METMATIFRTLFSLLHQTTMEHQTVFMFVLIATSPYLYAQTSNAPTGMFSTKTTYADSFGGNSELTSNFNNTMQLMKLRKEQCNPIQVNIVFRHATRYPSKKDFNNLKKLIDLQEHINNGNTNILKTWKSQFQNIEPKILADVGHKEMFLLGQRFSQYFPELFTLEHFLEEKIIFKSSNTSRTIQSAKLFREGLQSMMGNNEDEDSVDFGLEVLPVEDDVLLRFFDICERFTVTVEDNKTALYEVKEFGEGKEVQAVVDRLTQTLNVSSDFKLSSGHAKTVHTICAYERGLLGHSDWCSVLTQEDMLVMEYWADLKHYWRKSYGYEINYHMSCVLLQDIFSALDRAVTSKCDSSPVDVFWFGHAETLFPLLAILGLFNDTVKLRADNFDAQQNRLFRGGKLSPFAGNIAFVMYECEEFMVEVLLNEKPVTLPCCDSSLCLYATVKKCYSKWLNNCNFKHLCDMQYHVHSEL